MSDFAPFDNEAKAYDDWLDTKLGFFANELELNLALGMLDIKPGMNALDVGAGTGNFSLELAKRGLFVTGIDVSLNMLKEASAKANELELTLELEQMNAEEISYPDESFDIVTAITSTEFMADFEDTFAQMLRVLKPGGQLLIASINSDSEWGKLYMSDEMQESSVYKYATFRSAEYFQELNEDLLMAQKETLHLSPFTNEEDINEDTEEQARLNGNAGGFICTLWKK